MILAPRCTEIPNKHKLLDFRLIAIIEINSKNSEQAFENWKGRRVTAIVHGPKGHGVESRFRKESTNA